MSCRSWGGWDRGAHPTGPEGKRMMENARDMDVLRTTRSMVGELDCHVINEMPAALRRYPLLPLHCCCKHRCNDIQPASHLLTPKNPLSPGHCYRAIRCSSPFTAISSANQLALEHQDHKVLCACLLLVVPYARMPIHNRRELSELVQY